MTYVAEPYLHIADQLLTALTGGIAREAHRFLPAANAFSFELDAAKVRFETVTVIGEAGQEFYAFQPGRDYTIDPDDHIVFLADEADPLLPASGATWPDENSEFFVSYYHLDSDRAPLTDRNVGSLTRTLAESFARELTVLRRQLDLVNKSAFVDTAEGPALDMVVALLGLTRKNREFASGVVRFFRDTPAPADVFIPAGTVVSTTVNPPAAFSTTVDKTLRRGQLAVEVDVRAEQRGVAGVVDAGAITVVNRPILGITGVVNEAPTVFGGSEETDPELRARSKTVLERAGKATVGAVVNALTQAAGLKENEVKLSEELTLRPGVVKVFVARDPTAELATAVQEAILSSRPAGVRFEHNLEVALMPSPDSGLPAEDGREDGVTESPDGGGDFRQPLCCDVFIHPQNLRVAGPERAALEAKVRAAASAYVDAAPIGGTLVYNRIVADVMGVEGVLDVVLNVAFKDPASTSCAGMRNVQLASGQKATLDPQADLTVRFAGAPVSFDFQIAVTPKEGADLAAIREEITDKLTEYFAATPTTITAAGPEGLLAKLGASSLYDLQPEDLNWTAEFEQAGMIIRQDGSVAAETSIASTDRAALRQVSVEAKTGGGG